jgi:hypothetical protein
MPANSNFTTLVVAGSPWSRRRRSSRNAPSLASVIVCKECRCRCASESCATLDLSARPHAKLQNLLELVGRIIPPVVVAKRVCWQVVVCALCSSCAV